MKLGEYKCSKCGGDKRKPIEGRKACHKLGLGAGISKHENTAYW